MDPKSFVSEQAGRIIRVGQGETAYSAFLPNPLPPNISPDWRLTNAISNAAHAVSELAGLGRMLPNPHLFIRPFLHREAVLSSKIEGTQSDLTDIYLFEGEQMVIPGMEPPEPEDADIREVYNYIRSLEYGLDQLKEKPVSLWLLRGLHKVLLEGVRGRFATPGEYRTRQNWIGGSTINTAVFVPPPVNEMDPALLNLEGYLSAQDNYPPLIRLGILHYQFEAIHPFVDGNGRIGRLMISLLLIDWGIMELPLLHLSPFFERHRQTYYDLLLGVSRRGDWLSWLEFFLGAVAAQSKDTIERIKRIQDLQRDWHGKLGTGRASHSTHQLLDHLFVSPIITIPGAKRMLNMSSYAGAQNVVERLVQMGMLRLYDEREYGKRFVSSEILRIVTEDTPFQQ